MILKEETETLIVLITWLYQSKVTQIWNSNSSVSSLVPNEV